MPVYKLYQDPTKVRIVDYQKISNRLRKQLKVAIQTLEKVQEEMQDCMGCTCCIDEIIDKGLAKIRKIKR